MVWIKYSNGKEVFLGFKRGRLLRLGTRGWGADFELKRDMHVNEVMLLYKRIVLDDLDYREAAELLGARVIDVRTDTPRLNPEEFDEVHYRWDAIKYVKRGRAPLYQRRGEEKVYDSGRDVVF